MSQQPEAPKNKPGALTVAARVSASGRLEFQSPDASAKSLRQERETLARCLVWDHPDGTCEVECIDMGASSQMPTFEEALQDVFLQCIDLVEYAESAGHAPGYPPRADDLEVWGTGKASDPDRRLVNTLRLVRFREWLSLSPMKDKETVEYHWERITNGELAGV